MRLFPSTTLNQGWVLESGGQRKNLRKLPQNIAQFVMFHMYSLWS